MSVKNTIKKIHDDIAEETITLSVLVTEKCNFSCEHCMYECGPENKGTFVNENVFDSVIQSVNTLQDARINIDINLIGGEPTLYMSKLRKLLKRLNGVCRIYMTTNGWWLSNPKATRRFIDCVNDIDDIYIRISNDVYHDKCFYDNFTRRWSREELFGSMFLDKFGLVDNDVIRYDEDFFLKKIVEDDPWIWFESSTSSNYINNVGRAYRTGAGLKDYGNNNQCTYSLSPSILPNGRYYDGCGFGSILPFGSILRDGVLCNTILNRYFINYIRYRDEACIDCRDKALLWSKSNNFKYVKSVVKNVLEDYYDTKSI